MIETLVCTLLFMAGAVAGSEAIDRDNPLFLIHTLLCWLPIPFILFGVPT